MADAKWLTDMAEALIALGGNVGDVRTTLDRAVAALCDGRDVWLMARSSDYRTPPWGVTDQPAFINLALVVETALAPRALLERALRVETSFGRDRARETRWGPRTLDIDIIAYDDIEIDNDGLTLPHPRLFERAFVLAPLAEIAPDRAIKDIRIADALARLGTSGIEKLL
jgi:2-amino-4-hydroxy-6-hydroxymethyldihydropteridine diphosphokinase